MTQDIGKVDLGKLEADIAPYEQPGDDLRPKQPEVRQFAPAKYRPDTGTLEAIQNDVRKCLAELDMHCQRLDDYRQHLKAVRDAMAKTLG